MYFSLKKHSICQGQKNNKICIHSMKKDSISINNILFQRENEGGDKIARIRFKNDLEIINYEFPRR